MADSEFKDKLFMRLEAIEDLPSLPVVIVKLTEAVQNVDSSASDVAKIMESDPSIMSRVLKVVNSSFYSTSMQSEPITNVKHAIVRLGYDAVRNIALTSSVFTVFKDDHAQTFDRKEFWRHSICTGLVANLVYEYCKLSEKFCPKESVALAGLLHDIGKIIMEQYFYDAFSKILEFSHTQKKPIFSVEDSAIGVGHAEVGAWLAKKWKMNPDIVATIEFHHKPLEAPEEFRQMVSLVHIADYICNLKQIGQSGNSVPPPLEQDVWDYLHLDIKHIDDIVERVDEEVQKSEILLSL